MLTISRFVYLHVALTVLVLWFITNSMSELSLHVYPFALAVYFALVKTQFFLNLLKRQAFVSKRCLYFLILLFLIALRMLHDLDSSKVRELLFGTTGGVILFYLMGSLVSFNLSALRELWWTHPTGGAIFLLCLSATIILAYTVFIYSNNQVQDIMSSFIYADGSYQRKGSILTILYIVFVMVCIYSRECLTRYKKFIFVVLLPVTLIALFYSQYVRSNSAFVTIFAIYLAIIITDFSSIKLWARIKIFSISLLIILGISVYFVVRVPELLEFFSHFRVFGYGKFEFSSVTSRINLFTASLEQFTYGPILGDMNSDFKAGQAGKYPHNLLAHALTHLGLVGFFLMTTACILLLIRSRLDVTLYNLLKKYPDVKMNTSLSVIIIPIVCISLLFQTITWAPFWFTVGLSFPVIVRRHV